MKLDGTKVTGASAWLDLGVRCTTATSMAHEDADREDTSEVMAEQQDTMGGGTTAGRTKLARPRSDPPPWWWNMLHGTPACPRRSQPGTSSSRAPTGSSRQRCSVVLRLGVVRLTLKRALCYEPDEESRHGTSASMRPVLPAPPEGAVVAPTGARNIEEDREIISHSVGDMAQ